jgi:Zn-finger nucleic acid-binding protein
MEGGMDCAKCEGSLIKRELERIRVDERSVCHGIWFDSDELQLITSHLCAEPVGPFKFALEQRWTLS